MQKKYEWVLKIYKVIEGIFDVVFAGISILIFVNWIAEWNLEVKHGIWIACALYVVVEELVVRLLDWFFWLNKFFVGKFLGYRFMHFGYKKFYIYRNRGKIKFRIEKRSAPGGRCVMLPPERKNEENHPYLYMYGGQFGCTVAGIICILIVYFRDIQNPLLMVFAILYGITSVLRVVEGVIYDIVYNWDAIIIYKEEWFRRGVRRKRQIEYEVSGGKMLCELPQEWFRWDEEYEFVNREIEWLAYYCFQYLMYTERYTEAEQMLKDVLELNVKLKRIRKHLVADHLYLLMLFSDDEEEIKDYYEKNKDDLINENWIGSCRTCYLYFKYMTNLTEVAERYRTEMERKMSNLSDRMDEEDVRVGKKLIQLIEEKYGEATND